MDQQGIRRLYDAFNTRNSATALALMTDDVDWPNAWEGGRVQGREAVRSYWARQWAEVDTRVEPITIDIRPDGHIAVDVHQIARDLNGKVLREACILHVYELRDGLVARMDVDENPVRP